MGSGKQGDPERCKWSTFCLLLPRALRLGAAKAGLCILQIARMVYQVLELRCGRVLRALLIFFAKRQPNHRVKTWSSLSCSSEQARLRPMDRLRQFEVLLVSRPFCAYQRSLRL